MSARRYLAAPPNLRPADEDGSVELQHCPPETWLSQFGTRETWGLEFRSKPRDHEHGISLSSGRLTADEARDFVGYAGSPRKSRVRYTRAETLVDRGFVVLLDPQEFRESHCLTVYPVDRGAWDHGVESVFNTAWELAR